MTILKMNPDEYSVSAEYGPLLINLVEKYGISEKTFLGGLQHVDTVDWRNPSARLPLHVFEQAVHRALELTKAPWLGWEFGASLNLSSHGFLGYAAMSSETLRDSLELAVKFLQTRGTVLELQLFVEGETAVIQVDELVALNDVAPFMIESFFSSLHFMGSHLMGETYLDGELRFAYPEPKYFEKMRPIIPVNVLFDCAYHQMRFPAHRLDQKLLFADPRLTRMAADQCEQELASIKSPPKLLGQVRRIILGEAGRFPSVEETASELHMSSRTLKRKLQQLGTSYQRIMDDLRKGLAVEYLTQTQRTVDEIAIQLGYSDASNFARAFRRWTKKSPSDYRR
ncbi:MAG: AraC family transcriptional regulator ligand-binding domain-containing protein [Alcanivoracaceae bacterium]|nr:AraC family transcriptional regulator ligand-binding domain-containing protein [Alcanivoracaceae bacterium]